MALKFLGMGFPALEFLGPKFLLLAFPALNFLRFVFDLLMCVCAAQENMPKKMLAKSCNCNLLLFILD